MEWHVESERQAWPRTVGRPRPPLQRLLARPYAGLSGAAAPHRLLVPATVAVPLVLKVTDSPHRPPAFLHGVHDRYALMEGACAPSYLEVLMAPLGAYRVLGRPVTELGGGVVDLEDVFGAAGRRLLASVREAPSWRQRFDLLDRFLLRTAEGNPAPAPEVTRAWRLVSASGGRVAIRRVADDVGWSHKHLVTRFTQQVGVTPRTAARLVRFQHVLGRIRAGSPTRWEQLAADGGYADQPHLLRDFRAFTGVTPTDYLRRTGAGNRRTPRSRG